MERQPRRRLATASRRRRTSRANRFRANHGFLPRFENMSEIGQVPEGVPAVGKTTKLASVFSVERRSDARLEPAFPTLSLERKWRTRAAPRTSTRADAREHDAVSDETNIQEYSRHPTVPLCWLSRDDAAIAACQARGHLHVAPSQAERRNAKHSLADPCECPKCANCVHAFGKTEKSGVYPASHRATFLCTIAACQARMRDALELTQLRDNSFYLLVDLGLNQSRPITC
jgi:hypothetical protein